MLGGRWRQGRSKPGGRAQAEEKALVLTQSWRAGNNRVHSQTQADICRLTLQWQSEGKDLSLQQWGLVTVPKLPVDSCSWPHSHVFKVTVSGLSSSLGSICSVCKIISVLSHAVNSDTSVLLYWIKKSVFRKEKYGGCYILMWASKSRGGGGSVCWLKYMKYLEGARKSLPEFISGLVTKRAMGSLNL